MTFLGLIQKEDETAKQNITRLRQQASNYEFTSVDNEIKY